MYPNRMATVATSVYSMFGFICVCGNAFAATEMTPIGLVDASCVHKVPAGARIDAETGDVSVNDTSVDRIVECGAHRDASPLTCPPPPPGGWYEYSQTHSETISGLSQFNNFVTEWGVPQNAGNGLQYYFPALENQISGGAILQPVLQWASGEWTIASWAVWGCDSCGNNCSLGEGVSQVVRPSDLIVGTMTQLASNPDEWQVFVTDQTIGHGSGLDLSNIPNSWPKFSYVQGGVLEAYGIACTDLPINDAVDFGNTQLFQGGPFWNSANNVTASMSWSLFTNPFGHSPNCAWAPSMYYGSNTSLQWTQ
jgi:hypothetical protein